MRALKLLTIVMGVMIVVGTAVLIAVFVSRLSRTASSGPRPFVATPVEIPRGARVDSMTAGPDRLILHLILPDSTGQLLILDLATGTRLGSVELRPAP